MKLVVHNKRKDGAGEDFFFSFWTSFLKEEHLSDPFVSFCFSSRAELWRIVVEFLRPRRGRHRRHRHAETGVDQGGRTGDSFFFVFFTFLTEFLVWVQCCGTLPIRQYFVTPIGIHGTVTSLPSPKELLKFRPFRCSFMQHTQIKEAIVGESTPAPPRPSPAPQPTVGVCGAAEKKSQGPANDQRCADFVVHITPPPSNVAIDWFIGALSFFFSRTQRSSLRSDWKFSLEKVEAA